MADAETSLMKGTDGVSPFTRVHFRVVAHTHHGEAIHLVGDSPGLGCWEPLQGVALETDGESYPIWHGTISLPAEQVCHYKLVLIDGALSGYAQLKSWEGIQGNRQLLPRGEEMIVDVVMHEQPQQPAAPADAGAAQPAASLGVGATDQGAGEGAFVARQAAPAAVAQQAVQLPILAPLDVGAPLSAASDRPDTRTIPPLVSSKSAVAMLGGNGPFDGSALLRPASGAAGGGGAEHELGESELDESDAVMVVSYVLPVTISRTSEQGKSGWAVEWNQDSIVAKKHRQLTEAMRVLWVGCPHTSHTEELSQADKESLADALRPFHCMPVWVGPGLHQEAYYGFCRKQLWPVLHNKVKAYTCPTDSFSLQGWRAYTAVNKLFSDVVTEVYEHGDLVWVHDYHLLLLPSFILRKLRTASVGLFLHTPFPSSELFRTIPVRDELLRGMLNADLVGFHLFEYARSFLTCCKRMLGLEYEFVPGGFLAVRDQKRVIYVQASHVGIEPDSLAPHLRTVGRTELPAGLEQSAELRAALGSGRQLLGGIDECEPMRGLTLKLLAFETLLELHPHWQGKLAFIQVLVGARNFLPASESDSAAARAELKAIASRVNAAYPGSILLLELPTVCLAQRMALWAALHVAIFSAVKEGVNVYPLEYVYARSGGERAGVVVLSETCSCAHVLNGALRVNVWSADELIAAMVRALTMEQAERAARQQRDLIFVVSNTTQSWAERFFVDLKTVSQRSRKEDEPAMAIGFGLASFRCVGMGGLRTLEVTDVLAAYRKTVRRAIFVDWGGTLVPNDDRPLLPGTLASEEYSRRLLPAATHHCLEELCHDPRNFVMVVSGLARGQMESVFGGLPAISLAAEHGLLYRVGSTPGAHYRGAGHWEQIIESFNDDWKDLAHAIVETYAMRTNGSYVQRKGSSVVWRFEDADLEFGAQQAKEMREHLDNLLQGYPVDVQVGKGYVEIKPAGVDKGVIVSLMLNHLAASSGGVDFVLCVGDDSSDEKMFEALNSRFGGTAGAPTSPRGLLHGHTHVFCATVGRKPSAAPFYMNDHEEVLELLQSLRLHSTRSNRNRSLTDLKRLGNAAERNAAPAPGERGSIGRSTAGGGQHSAALANAVSTLAGGGASAGPAGRPYEHGPPIGSNSPSCAARSAGAMASGLYRQPGASYARSSDILPSSSATPSAGRTASMVGGSTLDSVYSAHTTPTNAPTTPATSAASGAAPLQCDVTRVSE